MTKSIFKAVLGGMLFGAAVYFMPFLILGIFIFFALFRLFAGYSMGKGRYGLHHIAWADKIRSMTDEEYSGFKLRISKHTCFPQHQEEIH